MMRRFLAAAALGLGLLSAGAALDGAGAAPFHREGPVVTPVHGDHWRHYAPPPRHHHWHRHAPPPRHYGSQHHGWHPRHHHDRTYGWR
ncbi:hypothetical protein JMJ56_09670 [Belnapia sp. T18]|uniref:Uncharacterized protein n=1 Tax=Belnapia arida TaxID=2804533 RepID=A0ABS1U0R2_9PROT|nr:hypothetical protein [Belnapia arida]MBL6078272.1 hypothetical protein [Belnapia arida]